MHMVPLLRHWARVPDALPCLLSSFLFSLWFSSAKHSDRLKTTVEYSCCSLREVSHTNECRDRSAYFLKACHWPTEVSPATSTLHSAFKSEKVHVWAVQHGCAPCKAVIFILLVSCSLSRVQRLPSIWCWCLYCRALCCWTLQQLDVYFNRGYPLDHLLILSLTWQTCLCK